MQTRKKQTIQNYDILLPEPVPKRRHESAGQRMPQIEDAVFEVISAGAPHCHRTNDNPPPRATASRNALLPMLARLAGRFAAFAETELARLSPQAFVTLLSSLFIAVFWLCGGFSALNAAEAGRTPQQPFAVQDLVIAVEDANGMKIAAISGSVTNASVTTAEAPRLKVVLGKRREAIGSIQLPVAEIGPQAIIRFSGRFKLAGGKSSDIAIIAEAR